MAAALAARADLEKRIAALCFEAKREMPKGRRFDADPLTPYEVRHARIDALLDQLKAGK